MASDLDNLRALMGNLEGVSDPQAFKKALTAATGFVGYNLEAEAKLMLPMFAGLRSRVPTDTPNIGAPTAVWRMMLGYGAYSFGASMGTAFGANGNPTTPVSTTISADYKSQSVNGDVEWEAIQQSRGWDDALAIETSIALSTAIRLDEYLVLGGNEAALDAPVPVGAASTLSAANTFAAGTWTVKVTALTLQGTLTNAAANSNVGESLPGAVNITVGVGDCDFLDVYWPAVPGAVGYKVYCESAEGAGDSKLVPPAGLRYRKITAGATDLTAFGDAIVVPSGQTWVGVNHIQVVAVGSGANAPGADGSVNANSFEGLIPWCQKTSMYGTSGLTHFNKDMDGAALTTLGTGISEFDFILQNLWVALNISPNLIVTSANGVTSLGNHLVAANNGAMFRAEIYQERNKIIGGLYIGGYTNKFASSMMGVQASIDVWAHPYMPDGTFLFLTETMPPSYKYSRTGSVFGLDIQTPYTYWELGRTKRSIPFDIMFGETLKCYYPTAQACISGARVDA